MKPEIGFRPPISAREVHLQQRTPNGAWLPKVLSPNQEIDLIMKKVMLITLMILAVGMFAAAQIQAPTSDVLGAHLNYGRGCAACHAPHSGAWGNGANKSGDTLSGTSILWGQDVGNLVGKTINTGGANGTSYTEVLPAMSATTPDVNGLLTCL